MARQDSFCYYLKKKSNELFLAEEKILYIKYPKSFFYVFFLTHTCVEKRLYLRIIICKTKSG